METALAPLNDATARRLPLSLVALVCFGAAWLSSLLVPITAGLPVLSLHMALAFGVAVHGGMRASFAAAFGIAVFTGLQGASFAAAAALFAGVSVGGFLANRANHKWRAQRQSLVAKRLFFLALCCLVFAPPVALALASSQMLQAPTARFAPQWLFGHLAFVAFSGVLFAPLSYTWQAKGAGAQAPSALGPRLSRLVFVLVAVLLLVAHVLGQDKVFVAGNFLLVLSVAVSSVLVFVGSERASSTTIALVTTAVVLEQGLFAAAGANLVLLGPQERIALVSAFLFVGAVIGHLLNGLVLDNQLQTRALEWKSQLNVFSGLLNRRYFFKVLNQLTQSADRRDEFFAEIAIPDLNFWADFSGRQAAYRFDSQIVERIDTCLREHAHFFAHAVMGSYFVHLKATADPLAVAQTIESAVHEACALHGVKGMRLRAQIALVRVPRQVPANPEDILATLANTLHYADHSLKRWSMVTLTEALLSKQRQSAIDGTGLMDALSDGSIRVFTQTILPVHRHDAAVGETHTGLHFEVLARLKNADGGFYSPAQFLPVYANCGLLPQFDRVVIQTLFDALAQEPAIASQISACSINLTGPTLSDPDLLAFLEAQFAEAVITPRQVVFEITESDKIANLAQALENVNELRALGATIALDDFGTGLASFDYLKRFNPDWIKIDGSFVRHIARSPLDTEVVRSMVMVAKAAGIQVVAEQVEDQQSIDLVTQLGVDFIQGYGISKPQAITDMFEQNRDTLAREPAPESATLLA